MIKVYMFIHDNHRRKDIIMTPFVNVISIKDKR